MVADPFIVAVWASVLWLAGTDGSGTESQGAPLPVWVSAGVTACAFAVAALVFLRDSRDRVRAQARKVYAWAESIDQLPADGYVYRATVHNDGDAPIWDVELRPSRGATPLKPVGERLPHRPDIRPGECGSWEGVVSRREATERWPEATFSDSADRRWIKRRSELRRRRRRR